MRSHFRGLQPQNVHPVVVDELLVAAEHERRLLQVDVVPAQLVRAPVAKVVVHGQLSRQKNQRALGVLEPDDQFGGVDANLQLEALVFQLVVAFLRQLLRHFESLIGVFLEDVVEFLVQLVHLEHLLHELHRVAAVHVLHAAHFQRKP